MATKKDISDNLPGCVDGLTKQQAVQVVDSIFQHLTDCLSRGEEVRIVGFGIFAVKKQNARKGRNPSTGETIDIAARTNVRFAPAKALKDNVNAEPASAS